MLKYLEYIQKKPVGYRKKVTWGSSIVVTLLVFGVWMSANYYGTFHQVVAQKSGGVLSPLDSLRASAIDGLNNMQNQFNDVKSKIGSISSDYYEASVASSTTASSYQDLMGTTTSQ